MKSKTAKPSQNGTMKKNKENNGESEPGIAQGLRRLFVNELQNIYWVEIAINKAIPKLIKKATAVILVEALTRHLDVSKEHVTKLEEVFSSIGEKVEPQKCKSMLGLIKEAKEIMKKTETEMIRDVAIILAVQKVEHYEIATYGTLCSFAKTLGETYVASLLHEILEQEKAAGKKLYEIAESFIIGETAGIEKVENTTFSILESNRK